jgi:hypothetical protein
VREGTHKRKVGRARKVLQFKTEEKERLERDVEVVRCCGLSRGSNKLVVGVYLQDTYKELAYTSMK